MGIVEDCSFRPSVHAKDKMVGRGVSREEVLEVISKGAKKVFDSKVLAFFKELEVVYKPLPCNIFIITIYVKRGD